MRVFVVLLYFDNCREATIFSVFSHCVCFHTQDSKNGAPEEEEKQAENGKKEEERGKEQEGEREGDKTDSEMGTKRRERRRNEALSSKDERFNSPFPP